MDCIIKNIMDFVGVENAGELSYHDGYMVSSGDNVFRAMICSEFQYPAEQGNKILVRIRNQSNADYMQVWFSSSQHSMYEGYQLHKRIPIIPNLDRSVTYLIDFSTHSAWNDMITMIRIDFGSVRGPSGDITIESVKIVPNNMIPQLQSLAVNEKSVHCLMSNTTSHCVSADNEMVTVIPQAKRGDIFVNGNRDRITYVPLDFGNNIVTIDIIDQETSVVNTFFLNVFRCCDYLKTHKEPYRPQLHFTPLINWMNDPNGLMYDSVGKKWHLFFQYNPHGIHWGNESWGHAVSDDLVHWSELPVALPVDELGMIFSGSCVIDKYNTSGFFDVSNPKESRIVAIIPHAAQYPQPRYGNMKISLAYSKDSGETWVQYAGNPVLYDGFECAPGGFSDPKVIWLESEQQWLMAVLYNNNLMLYTSQNLIHWKYESHVRDIHGEQIKCECPDIYPLPLDDDWANQKWVVNMGGDQYMIGDLLRNGGGKLTFRPETEKMLYNLKTGYATQTFYNDGASDYTDLAASEAHGRRLAVSWLIEDTSNDQGIFNNTEKPWNGCQSLVQELKLRTINGEMRLCASPAQEIKQVREKTPIFEAYNFELTKDSINPLEDVNGKLLDIDMEFIPCDNMNEVQLCLRIKNDERLMVKWDAQDSAVSIDRTNAMKGASHGEPVYRANVSRNANGGISLRIILDTTAVEMFANDGEVFCNLLYYTMNDGEKLSLATTDGSLIVRKLVIYRLHDMEFFAKERG